MELFWRDPSFGAAMACVRPDVEKVESRAMADSTMSFAALLAQHCTPLKGAGNALVPEKAAEWLALLPGWRFGENRADIGKQFRFQDFVHALAFVNALGWIAERENHHPDLELGWGRVQVRFSTHDVGGLSINDFICAAKAEALMAS
jgi:4a-hydroxytetrahydrobiopterin dehydratase